MRIYLGDLVHTWEKTSTWTFPLNIAYVGSYAKKMLGDDIDLKFFKRPELLIEALRVDPPDVLGLSFYVWNANLNKLVFDIAKRSCPTLLCVGGGPNFTTINNTTEQAQNFFEAFPGCDAYVPNQGELGFVELLKSFIECSGSIEILRNQVVPGCTIRGVNTGSVQIGAELDPIKNLDDIPSPYLNGMLDEFFKEPFAPVLETNRSCPYRCTFCAWGISSNKLTYFSDERVLAEIDYIGQRCKNAVQLFISDANFGILDRDAIFGRALTRSHEKYGFPGHLAVQWHKSRPDRVLATAKEVKSIARIGASMQSLNPATLEAVKRKNLPLSALKGMLDELGADGIDMPLVSELILGLPEETRESHLSANKTMIDSGAEMINYNLYLLPGTEMDSKASRATYFRETGWRLMDNAFGIYDGVKVFEGQETVQATSTMSRDELRGFRFFHFLLQFMWGGRWYFDYLNLFRLIGVHPVDLIDRLTSACRSANGPVGDLYVAFSADHDLETFKTYEDMCSYWADEHAFRRLQDGSYGKLNYAFTYKVLLECHEAFDEFLLDFARTLYMDSVATEAMSKDDFLMCCAEVLRFARALQIQLTESMDLVPEKHVQFTWDVLGWREANYVGLIRKAGDKGVSYRFSLPDRQREKLVTLLNQYRSHNINMTLRKMTEYIKPHEFFYRASYSEVGVSAPASTQSGHVTMIPTVGTHDHWQSVLADRGGEL